MGNVQMEASMIRYGSGTVKTALDNGGGGGGSSTLAGLTDTAITTPSNGQVLTYDSTATKWENAAIPAQSIDGLSDTTITSPSDGQVLTYDATAEKWENATPASGVTTLAALTDTAITTPTDGQVLKYDSASSKWVNGSGGSGGGGIDIAETETTIGKFATKDLYCKAFPITSITNTGTMDLTGIPAGATIVATWGGIVESGTFKALPYYTNVSSPGPIGFDISYSTDKWVVTWRCPSAHSTVTGHIIVLYTKESENNR